MKHVSFWIMFIPLLAGMIVTIIKNVRVKSPLVLKRVVQIFAKKPMPCSPDKSEHIIERFLFAGKKYFENNAYAIIRNYEMDARCRNTFYAGRENLLEPKISLLLLMKHSYITINAVDVHGKLTIHSSDAYKEIATAVDQNGQETRIKDNISIPYHYNTFFEKYFNEINLIPQRSLGHSIQNNILYDIIIVGRNTEIIDEVPNGSKLLATDCFGNTELKDNNRCFIVKSEEEALKLVEDIECVMERRVTLERDEIITGLNRIQRENI